MATVGDGGLTIALHALARVVPEVAVVAAISDGCYTVADICAERGLTERVVRRVLRGLAGHGIVERRRSTRHHREEIFVLR